MLLPYPTISTSLSLLTSQFRAPFVSIFRHLFTGCKMMSTGHSGGTFGSSSSTRANHLATETSPYLLQHAYNPVNWYPWCDEAFERAVKENKPVFLSIGYSTCHWCHVMEHESFEDRDVADLLNNNFVSIKVDREERPDIACQLITGSGGWPLSAFLSPNTRQPFYVATYIPKSMLCVLYQCHVTESMYGRPGMMDLLPRIAGLYRDDPGKVMDSATSIMKGVAAVSLMRGVSSSDIPRKDLVDYVEQGCTETMSDYDSVNGGFSSAPKFPIPHNITMLLAMDQSEREIVRKAVRHTLDAMRQGGIYDHVGGGIHRYSTDSHWLVPHFEKMLYDQALAIGAYCRGAVMCNKPDYLTMARDIITYLLRDLRSGHQAFYSAEDADSEGVEGKFYVWTKTEIENILESSGGDTPVSGIELSRKFCHAFNVKEEGNYHDEATGESTKTNILHGTGHGMPSWVSGDSDMRSALSRLFVQRAKRVRPHMDDKIMMDWNGLALSGLASYSLACSLMGCDDHGVNGVLSEVIDWLVTHMTVPGTTYRAYHTFAKGRVNDKIDAFASDYVFFINGLLEAYQATFDAHYIEMALGYQRELDDNYWDKNDGGYFSTRSALLGIRAKDVHDGAIPSPNGYGLINLVHLYHVTGNQEFLDKAHQMVKCFREIIAARPSAAVCLLQGVDMLVGPYAMVTVRGAVQYTRNLDQTSTDVTRDLITAATKARFQCGGGNRVFVLAVPTEGRDRDILVRLGIVDGNDSIVSPGAQVCIDNTCLPMCTSSSEVYDLISSKI